MSRNIINTIGHHVFRYDPPYFDESGAPCKSVVTSKNNKQNYPFIGEGYYFWDDNIGRAKRWGEQRCKGKYKIMECSLRLQGEAFLDLVGSREDIRCFSMILDKIKSNGTNISGMGEAIYRLQLMAHYNPKVFPFKIIRVLDVSKNRERIDFVVGKESKMLLNPEMIICFFDKKDIPLWQARVYTP